MRILGIDPGYERLGIAILEKSITNKNNTPEARPPGLKKEKVLYSECFKTSAKIEFSDRLFHIGQEVNRVIKEYKPEILAVETLFLNTNQKTAMKVSEVRGVLIYLAVLNNLKILEVSPPQIKMAISGYGRANKEQINKMVKLLVEIDKNKNSDDELDAIAIALTASALVKNNY